MLWVGIARTSSLQIAGASSFGIARASFLGIARISSPGVAGASSLGISRTLYIETAGALSPINSGTGASKYGVELHQESHQLRIFVI